MADGWQQRANELSARATADGSPTSWFEQLWSEGESGAVGVPWPRTEPHPLLASWTASREVTGEGRRAVVVGCGLGADAEHLGRLGFQTIGFDLSPAAVRQATARHEGSGVVYVVADLRHLPDGWLGDFDLVVEVFTLQAVPDPPRAELAAGVRSLVAPGGTLLAIQYRADGTAALDEGPPYPQEATLFTDVLARDGLMLVSLEEHPGPLWRAELGRA